MYFRTKKLFGIYDKNAIIPDFSEKYIFYPLHLEPEAMINPLGGVF
jgi:hypothetical protein